MPVSPLPSLLPRLSILTLFVCFPLLTHPLLVRWTVGRYPCLASAGCGPVVRPPLSGIHPQGFGAHEGVSGVRSEPGAPPVWFVLRQRHGSGPAQRLGNEHNRGQ